jgi:putative transcriptional regulator
MQGQVLFFLRRTGCLRCLLPLVVVLAFPTAPCTADTLDAGESASLTGMLLVASEGMPDPRFAHSVLLITKHDKQGAIALMINHPTRIPLSRALPDISELAESAEKLFIGGPMTGAPYMLLIRSNDPLPPDASKRIFDDVYFSVSADLIPQILNRRDANMRVYSGFASWAPGQLENELERGGWHLENADAFTIFEKPAARIWPDLSRTRPSHRWIKRECKDEDCYRPGDNALINVADY